MTFSRFFILVIIMLSSLLVAFAQSSKVTKEDVDRWLYEDATRPADTSTNSTTRIRSPEEAFVMKFLPDVDDSWLISITSEGGIFGGTKFTASINSNENFSCGNERSQLTPTTKDAFDHISDLLNLELPLKQLKNKKADRKGDVRYCNDCSTEYLTLYSRVKNRTIVNRYEVSTLSGNAKEIYALAMQSFPCQAK